MKILLGKNHDQTNHNCGIKYKKADGCDGKESIMLFTGL